MSNLTKLKKEPLVHFFLWVREMSAQCRSNDDFVDAMLAMTAVSMLGELKSKGMVTGGPEVGSTSKRVVPFFVALAEHKGALSAKAINTILAEIMQ